MQTHSFSTPPLFNQYSCGLHDFEHAEPGAIVRRPRPRMLGRGYDLLQKLSRSNADMLTRESSSASDHSNDDFFCDEMTETWWPVNLKSELLDKRLLFPHLAFDIWKVKTGNGEYQYGIFQRESLVNKWFLFRYKRIGSGTLERIQDKVRYRNIKMCKLLEETEKKGFFKDVEMLEVKGRKTREEFLKEWNNWPHIIDPALYNKFKKEQKQRALPNKTQRDINKKRRTRSNNSDKDKKQYKTLEATVKECIARWSDQTYFFTQFLYRKAMLPEPIGYIKINRLPTIADKKKKKDIFQINVDNQCVISGMISSGAGDHMFEINGYAKQTGKHGRYDWWNTIPVIGTWNKKYKKIPVVTKEGMKILDIGLHYLPGNHRKCVNLTEEQLEECLPEHARIYNMFVEWKKYCEIQGVSLFFEFNDADKKWLEEREQTYKTVLWDMNYLINNTTHTLPNGNKIQSIEELYALESEQNEQKEQKEQ